MNGYVPSVAVLMGLVDFLWMVGLLEFVFAYVYDSSFEGVTGFTSHLSKSVFADGTVDVHLLFKLN